MEGFKKDRKFSVLGLAVLWDRTQGLILGKCSGTEPQPQTNKKHVCGMAGKHQLCVREPETTS